MYKYTPTNDHTMDCLFDVYDALMDVIVSTEVLTIAITINPNLKSVERSLFIKIKSVSATPLAFWPNALEKQ